MNRLSLLSLQECQSARQARDARFDGRFYIAVKTTGIFCRPICPANLPKEENVEYFVEKAQALQAGYRPCLRCRPDSAPSSWAWKGVETTFLRAAQMIEQGELQRVTLCELSERLGISDRYLRQLFHDHLGMSPKQYALAHQLMFAKQLLHVSSMPITDIAFSSGFNSVRRFNDAFKKVMSLTPTQVRKNHNYRVGEVNHIDLMFKGPLDWQYMLDFYCRRAIDGLESVDQNSYQRQFTLHGSNGWFRARCLKSNVMRVEFELSDIRCLKALVTHLRRLFDLDSNIEIIEQKLRSVSRDLVQRRGIRIPGVWDPWEAGVRAILGQQVSVKAAIGHLNLLVKTLQPHKISHFPTPKELAMADLSFLRMPQSRKETLSRFAQFIDQQPQADWSQWLEVKGIGPWTVNYAKLRGASEPNCFLDGDLVVKKALNQFPTLNAQSASPWGSYATFHCWSQV
ncbi:DNA-3-methyladenine glycosylase 2 family protein [Vibrio ostreicida]|uniref:DNA-3-methyladenine glycosylase 2 family protein n=1 Tax=Vibrio ostreicida TaxID=526588 RepID=UPI003B5C9EFB